MSPDQYALDKLIEKAGKTHKLLGCDFETYQSIAQLKAQLNLDHSECVKFLVLYSGLDFKSDLRKDLKVQQIMSKMRKIVPR